MGELETVDLLGVEILSTGGPVRGVGSPPSGDYWTTKQLEGMAAAAAELGDELKPPAKIGHKGGDPAVGWLDNIRVNDTGDRLLADIRKVPKGLSSLIQAGAYRQRSVELSRLTSQKTGRKFDWAVTGLAWLGGKMPAVRTLGDVVKLYDGDGADDDREFVQIEETEADLDELRDAVGDLGLEYAASLTRTPSPAPDSRPMPKPVAATFTDEQRRKFAEATGLEADKVTDELLGAAGVVAETDEPPPVEDDDDAARSLEAQELRRELDEAKAAIETTQRELHDERKKVFVESALGAGRIPPAAREKLEGMYDKDPEGTRAFVAELPTDDNLGREYGANGEGDDEGSGDPETDEKAAMRLYEEAQESMRREEGALL